MVGTPWELVPGKQSQHIPVAISDEGEVISDEMEQKQPARRDGDEEDVDRHTPNVTPHNMHVSRKAIAKYGQTEGCPACDAIGRREHVPGKLGYNHNDTCRRRIMNEMMDDPEYRRLMQKHVGDVEPEELEMISEEQKQAYISNLKKAIMTIEKNTRKIQMGD